MIWIQQRNSYTGPTQVASIPITFKATIVLCRISLLNPNQTGKNTHSFSLAELVLINTHLLFISGQILKTNQRCGYGTKMGPSYANFFVGYIEQRLFYQLG